MLSPFFIFTYSFMLELRKQVFTFVTILSNTQQKPNKMKKINLFLATVISIVFTGCEELDSDKKVLNQDLTFTLNIIETQASLVKVKVGHNGTATDTWYAFVTTESNVKTAVEEKVQELMADGKISGLKKSANTTVTIRNLVPETDYKFIAIGLSEDGEIYGLPCDVDFTTTRDASILVESQDWSMEYNRDTNENGEKVETFIVQCAEGKPYYFTTIDKLSLEASEMTVQDYVAYVIDNEIPMMLDYGYTMKDLIATESYIFATSRMVSGDYYALAIGYDTGYKVTGFFSVQEFTIQEETAEPEYTQWLGTWDFTSRIEYDVESSDGGNEPEVISKDVTYKINIEHYDNNFMYIVTGCEDSGAAQYKLSAYLGDYGKAFPACYNRGMFEIQETTVGYVPFETGNYFLGIYGVADITYQGKTYESTLSAFDGVTMATATMEEDGTAQLIGTEQTVSDFAIKYVGMGYIAYPDAENGDLLLWNDPMQFPISMKKAEKSTQQSHMPVMRHSMSEMNRLSKRAYKSHYLKRF